MVLKIDDFDVLDGHVECLQQIYVLCVPGKSRFVHHCTVDGQRQQVAACKTACKAILMLCWHADASFLLCRFLTT